MSDTNENMDALNKIQTTGHSKLLSSIQSCLKTKVNPLLIACFELLDDTLFDLAEKAESNKKQSVYFESMRNIRKSRDQIFSHFFSKISEVISSFEKKQFDYFGTDVAYNPEVKSLTLSLVDESELDECLAKTNIINKSEMAFHQQIFSLEKRFAHISQIAKIKSTQIPVGPYVIVNAFSHSVKEMDLDVTLKLIVYKIFERTVMGQLNAIFKEINDILIDNGILKDLSFRVSRRQSSPSPQQQTATASQVTESEPDATSHQLESSASHSLNPQNSQDSDNQQNTSADENYALISQLFSKTHHQTIPMNMGNNQVGSLNSNENSVSENTNNVNQIDLSTMMNALSSLQSSLINNNTSLQQPPQQTPTEIKDALIKQLHDSAEENNDIAVRQRDEDTIDLVGMLFQFIVDDRNLPDAIQVILAKLQIPYLKIALQNRSLFADKLFPARVLLDSLSLASVGWSKENDNKNLFINKIEEIAQKVLEFEDYSDDDFNELQNDFDAFLKKSKKKSDIYQKRAQEKTLGHERIERAKKECAELLVEKMTNKKMPILVRDILLGEWSNVMVLMFLRHNSDSAEFNQKTQFIDTLIEYSQPELDNDINNADIQFLSNDYKEGLELVAFNPKDILDKQDVLVKCLKELHLISEKQSNIVNHELIDPKDILELSQLRKQNHEIIGYIEEVIEPSIDENDYENIDDEFTQIIKDLKIGTWLEFTPPNKKPIRGKLTWISPITEKYLFVNSKGLKITDKTKLALADGLRNKTINVLQQVLLFDRALSSIANKMKKEKSIDEVSE